MKKLLCVTVRLSDTTIGLSIAKGIIHYDPSRGLQLSTYLQGAKAEPIYPIDRVRALLAGLAMAGGGTEEALAALDGLLPLTPQEAFNINATKEKQAAAENKAAEAAQKKAAKAVPKSSAVTKRMTELLVSGVGDEEIFDTLVAELQVSDKQRQAIAKARKRLIAAGRLKGEDNGHGHIPTRSAANRKHGPKPRVNYRQSSARARGRSG